MKSTDPTPPMFTQSVEPSTDSSPGRRPRVSTSSRSKRSAEAGADAVADRILGVLQGGDYVAARDMANEAVRRFPKHARLEKLRDFFDPRGKAHVVSGGPEPSREKELAWLSSPPEWAHGKWVALVGDEVVAHGDTLKEVTAVTRSQSFARRPLVHRVD